MAEQRKSNSVRRTKKNTVTENKLEILITTIPRNKAEYYIDLIQSFEVNMQMAVLAEGTANSGMLAALGINNSAKVVIISVIKQKHIPDAIATLEEKFNTIRGGKGIAFTIPMSSVIGTLIYGFLSNDKSVAEVR